MEAFKENQLELALPSNATSYEEMLEYQKSLFCSQIEKLEDIVAVQCKLTGVNPLSQEMAAGALSIKIGKRPRDLLNPKAVKYMQEVFSIKDAIGKKEVREISALFGITATQVRDFFNSQRTRVRKFVRLSIEKANKSNSVDVPHDGVSPNPNPSDPITPVPLNSLDPVCVEEGPTCSTQEEVLPGIDESDKHFVENIFILMRKEETFAGQVRLMDWILQVQNPSVLYWFLTKGGVMILATWLTQAAVEEQTSVLHVILKVLCHLPLQKALPVHMSATLQSVNKLRFYRASDISNRARILLSRLSKMFARSQALKKSNGIKSANDVQDEMLLKQSINEVMGNDTWDSKLDLHEGALTPFNETSNNSRKPESPLKMLTSSADDSNKKLVRGGLSSHTRERRKVLLMEQPGQKTTGRGTQVTRSMHSTHARPLSADDIQKAKMRAQFLQNKHGKTSSSTNESSQVQPESSNKCISSGGSILISTPQASIRPKAEEQKKSDNLPISLANKQETLDSKMILDSEEPLWQRCKRVQIPWKTPAGMEMNDLWKIGVGDNSKEVEVQKNRIRREREIVYNSNQDIPSNPKEPWDREMDYDDSLTPEIPTAQLPDVDVAETVANDFYEADTVVPHREDQETAVPSASSSSQNGSGSVLEPDLELLSVLLKNPELVFALTSGQAGNLSSEDTVKLLDMIKANGLNSVGSVSGLGTQAEKVEVSLPSPTPSTDPITSGWKNPFSRASGEGRHVPGVHSHERLVTGSLMQSQVPSSIYAQQSSIVQQLSQPSTLLVEHQQPSMIHASHQAPIGSFSNIRLPPLELNVRNGSAYNTALPNLDSDISPPFVQRLQTSTYVMPSPTYVEFDTHERPPTLPIRRMRTPTPPSPPRPQTEYDYAPDPSLSHSWRERQGFNEVQYTQGNVNRHHSYTENVGGPMIAPMHQPHSWERDAVINGSEFESWSPDKSPVRSRDYLPQRNYTGPRMNPSHNYIPERSMPRHPGYSPEPRSMPRNPGYPPGSGYGDPNQGGQRRWRDRRR